MLAILGAGKAGGVGGGGGSGTQVTALTRFENSTDGTIMSVAIATAGTVGSGITWTTNPGTLLRTFVSTAAELKVDGLQVSGGTGYGDSGGTRGMRSRFNVASTRDYILAGFTGSAKVSVGYVLKLGLTWAGGSFSGYNPCLMEGSAGDYCAFDFEDFPAAGFGVKCETQNGTGTIVNMSANTSYWITQLFDQAANAAKVRVYTTPGLSLVGESTQTFVTASTCDHVAWGRYDTHGGSFDEYIYYDDLAMDLTGALWPLLPNSF